MLVKAACPAVTFKGAGTYALGVKFLYAEQMYLFIRLSKFVEVPIGRTSVGCACQQ